MAIAFILVIAFLLVVLPQLWIFRAIDRYAVERPDLPATGGAFAREALDRMGLAQVKVEPTELGNHYDPEARAVRLEQRFLNGKSLSAITIAAHEVGHAMQHAMQMPMFERRIMLAKRAHLFNMIASGFLFAAPLLMLIGKTPMAMIINVVGFVGMHLLSIATQIMTLPVEFDASFKRALPLLERGNYLHNRDMPAARNLLKAAAYTYVAGLLRSLIAIPGMGRLPR
jgi:uncharacterized protein